MTVPAKYGEAYMTPAVPIEKPVALPYVIFTSTKNGKYPQMVQAIPGLQEAEPVLVQGETFTRLNPFKAHVVSYRQLWVERTRDQQSQALSVLTSRPADWKVPQQEEVHTVLLVYTPDGIVSATCTFKKGLAKGAVVATDELVKVSNPSLFSEWLKKSPEHKAAAAIDLPMCRFTALFTAAMCPSKSGGKHPESRCTVKPTTLGDWTSIQKFLANAGLERTDAVRAFNDKRVGELLKLEVTK